MSTLDPTPTPSHTLGREEYKTLSLSALGGTLEFYDFVIFVFFSATLGHLFFPNTLPDWVIQLQTLGIFAAGYLARPLGGIIIAHYGDKLGRKRMFTLSIFLMAAPTLLIGLLPTYEVIGVAAPLLLLAMRVLQGAAIGGEMPGAWVFVAEHVPHRHSGFSVGVLTAGICGGILLGSLIAIFINRNYSAEEIAAYAWRIPFILGGLFGFISVYLRRFLSETPVFKELAAKRAIAQEMPVKTVVREHRAGCLLTGAYTWSLSTAVVVLILMTPTMLQKMYQIATAAALEANCVGTLMLVIGCGFFGWLSDRIGMRLTLLFCWGGLALSSYHFYTALPGGITAGQLMFNYGLMGFFVGSIATMAIVGVRAFPPAIRYSGLSFSYNIAYAIFGGLTPVVTQLWLQRDPLAGAHYVALVSVLAMVLAALPLTAFGWTAEGQARRTRGLALDSRSGS
ncbi:MAG: MFS transporter [Candidatus Dactylopiibacterium carminicum]|uniref:MFS transporter n=1 Tax=Candidatus Dactylopiibacterium carminicum TaxID=857335 RepID=A0A272EYB7_9RHOO|nr:MFS transporter [Candidatus Dactylopiibacterium carminicum]KAF7600642.1 MFS transporter [Candidatus Dactylopiibacterium carminicum]PAS95124.1 MAG: MFS transporter [Candidatus Dactylopiibacterium carminicum]PAS97928.1 MAG: MFS transporter [Candidatus Dactylopiibacterium carminicum]PAT00639.1 MAG: MFS transporter [Candidatus Dactylopiibacterium carminicum]